jgi:hypothetical protein
VIIVTTADRINPGYRAWSPSAVVTDDEYTGKHRRDSGRSLSLHRMFYRARHGQR